MKDMEDLVLKYIRGEASQQEAEAVLGWLAESEQNKQFYMESKLRFIKGAFPDTEASHDDLEEFLEGLALHKRFESNPKGAGSVNHVAGLFTRIAAVLFIPLLLFTGYLLLDRGGDKRESAATLEEYVHMDTSAILTYHTNPGVKGYVELPDGSSVILNSGSKIRVPIKFDRESRIVELEGEGYFNVAADSTWPMYVNTNRDISVKVLGTTFNLSTYGNDGELRFTLIEGRVKLLAGSNGVEIDVEPMQEVVIPDNRSVKGIKREANVQLNTGWKDGHLVFEDTPMDEVVRRMERWFGATINVSNQKLLEYRFTASFRSESLSQVLELVNLSTNIKYSVRDNNVVTLYLD